MRNRHLDNLLRKERNMPHATSVEAGIQSKRRVRCRLGLTIIDGWRMEANEDRGAAEAWANGQVRALPFRAVWYVPLCLEQQAAFP